MNNFDATNKLLEQSSFFYNIAIDMDGRYSYVSPNYDKKFDFVNESLLGKLFSITLHPDDILVCDEVANKCFTNPGKLFPATLRKHNGKGGFIVTQWEMQAIVNDKQESEGIFCIGYNITEHVSTMLQLYDAESEIASKSEKLHEIGILQSHGVRKPLANIIGLAGVLSTMELDSNLNNIKDMIVDSAKQLDQVIKEITYHTAK